MAQTAPDICIYHGNCQDGFTAAWAVWRRFGDAVTYVPGVYGVTPPDVTGKDVLIVDFSYKQPVLREMAEKAKSITILDHHKTAQEDVGPLLGEGLIGGLFDMEKSGARLAWEYCHGPIVDGVEFDGSGEEMLVLYVEDRDLWRFELISTREIAATIFSHPYSFEAWDSLAKTLGRGGHDDLIREGTAIERKHFKDIKELLAICTREMIICGHRVKVANMPYTLGSDAAGMLAEGAPFGATYYQNAEREYVFSLRSKPSGEDVSVIAAKYGGGGHARASGFVMGPGWLGDWL